MTAAVKVMRIMTFILCLLGSLKWGMWSPRLGLDDPEAAFADCVGQKTLRQGDAGIADSMCHEELV